MRGENCVTAWVPDGRTFRLRTDSARDLVSHGGRVSVHQRSLSRDNSRMVQIEQDRSIARCISYHGEI